MKRRVLISFQEHHRLKGGNRAGHKRMFAILDQEREASGMETLSQEDGKKVVGEREGTISCGVEEEGKPRELGVEGATSDRH